MNTCSVQSCGLTKRETCKFQWIVVFCVVATIPYPPAPYQVAVGVAAYNSNAAAGARMGNRNLVLKNQGCIFNFAWQFTKGLVQRLAIVWNTMGWSSFLCSDGGGVLKRENILYIFFFSFLIRSRHLGNLSIHWLTTEIMKQRLQWTHKE